MIVGLYIHGNSFLHKLDIRLKLFLFIFISLLIFFTSNLFFLTLFSFVLLLLFHLIQGLGLQLFLKASRPLFLWVIFIFIFQLYINDIYLAIFISLKIISIVWLASLVTFTSKMDAMSEAFIFFLSWLKYFGVSLNKLGFILSLSIRMIPFVFKTYEEIREVYAARGINSNVINLLPQVLIRVIRDANSMGLALSSRGCESWDDK